MSEIVAEWLGGRVRTPDGPARVEELYETHSAYVFLTPGAAYKQRKAVRLAFLDYSARGMRWTATVREAVLGRRAAGDIYLGVARLHDGLLWPVHGLDEFWPSRASLFDPAPDAGFPDNATPDGEPVLVMTRLPSHTRADVLFGHGTTAPDRLRGMVEAVAALDAAAPVCLSIELATSRAWRAWADNLGQLPDNPHGPLTPADHSYLQAETQEWWSRHATTVADRVRAGRVRDRHGDLRPENVFLTEPCRLIDPLEFSADLRICDLASEVAFFAVELDALGRTDAAAWVCRQFEFADGHDGFAAVLPFYKRHRAVVRGKVECIRANQYPDGHPGRATHLDRARTYFDLAVRYPLT
jgi:aminoglycoside phosphotransferase family enzyme